MEGIRLPLRADGQALEVLTAEELLLQLSLKRGRHTNLLADLHGGLVEAFGDYRQLAGDVQDSGRALLNQQHVVPLVVTASGAPPRSGKQRNWASHTKPLIEGQGRGQTGEVPVLQRQLAATSADTTASPARCGTAVASAPVSSVSSRSIVSA